MKKDVPRREVPKFDELMSPTLQALKRLGGSASIDELVPEIVEFLGLSQEGPRSRFGTTGRTELEYRAAWARTYLRNAGYSRIPSEVAARKAPVIAKYVAGWDRDGDRRVVELAVGLARGFRGC